MDSNSGTRGIGAADAAALEELVADGDPVASVLSGDPVLSVVEQVRADLARRRARGELPDFPAGELERHFDGVVEAVDAGLVAETRVDTSGLAEAAALPAWAPVPTGSPIKRIAVLLIRFPARVLGLFVRRQVSEFSEQSASVITQVADRQNRISMFLARTHLDRVRSLELRVAQLEQELIRLRDGEPDASSPED